MIVLGTPAERSLPRYQPALAVLGAQIHQELRSSLPSEDDIPVFAPITFFGQNSQRWISNRSLDCSFGESAEGFFAPYALRFLILCMAQQR